MVTLKEVHDKFNLLFDEVGKVVVGQHETLKEVLIAMMCGGNALLEGYPGLAKTLSINTLSNAMDLSFSRIQSTPDLLPSDITGTYIIKETAKGKVFQFQKGPVFANVVLVDEINRATPKTQSALLEAMQERQVTVGNNTYQLDYPFFVLATQNPIEQEGTYPLPEAQADRFLLKIKLDYPSLKEEHAIVDMYSGKYNQPKIKKVFTKNTLEYLQGLVRQVPIASDIKQYAVKVVTNTRHKKDLVEFGASPRASIGLVLASKAHALVSGRKYVSKVDVDAMAYPILRHRIILNFEAERNNLSEDDVIKRFLR